MRNFLLVVAISLVLFAFGYLQMQLVVIQKDVQTAVTILEEGVCE